jgi:hypothetical protein
MAKHLVDIDEVALSAARAELGTLTLKDTVNQALARVVAGSESRVNAALDVLADMEFVDREDAWR